MTGPLGLGRSAVIAVVGAALLTATVTACGSQRGGTVQASAPSATSAATPQPSFSPRPLCAQPDGDSAPPEPPAPPSASAPDASGSGGSGGGNSGPDAPPNYGDNHAYRMAAELSEEAAAQGEGSAELIRAELEVVMQQGDFSDRRITKALAELGCGPEHGVYVSQGFYSVHTGVACVSGNVAADEMTSRVHGSYSEPQPGTGPCVKNRGGH
ncbi:hypothetical protein [Streptomyces sp. NPDC059452]|uniref:hypothetical protein n=1 Tax=Streptomyces sp. NPDC059452 TaxID=3346835 RepID=UPI00368E1BC2